MWQHSAPSNQITPTHQHNSQVEDSPSDPPELPEEETLESQEEYPQEVAEEEVFLLQYQRHKQLPMGEINSLATRRLHSQEIAPNQKNL